MYLPPTFDTMSDVKKKSLLYNSSLQLYHINRPHCFKNLQSNALKNVVQQIATCNRFHRGFLPTDVTFPNQAGQTVNIGLHGLYMGCYAPSSAIS